MPASPRKPWESRPWVHQVQAFGVEDPGFLEAKVSPGKKEERPHLQLLCHPSPSPFTVPLSAPDCLSPLDQAGGLDVQPEAPSSAPETWQLARGPLSIAVCSRASLLLA